MSTGSKIAIAVLAIAAIGFGVFYFAGTTTAPVAGDDEPQRSEAAVRVAPGTYRVDPAASEFRWSARRPLIDGYVNSGTIGVQEGEISVGEDAATGSFTIDMDTIHVGLTATKPGREGALERHLKSDDFFDVEQYPTATFTIDRVEPLDEANFRYTIHGTLTMKGVSESLSFPATIYLEDDVLSARADFEFDRTTWGITYGSGGFFQNLGDNLIGDMVAVSFSLVAPRTE